MKKLLLLLLIAPMIGFGQGEQRYADGTATDQDGNTFEWINYGTQDWAIENAKVVTYRDGTPISLWTGTSETFTGYYIHLDFDSTKNKLYNWYAVVGDHDNNDNTPNKEFAPEGWRVASESDWNNLKNYLIENGYNFDGTTTGNKIAKALASVTGWEVNSNAGAVGNDQSSNNRSGFNATPDGMFSGYGAFWNQDKFAIFHTPNIKPDGNTMFEVPFDKSTLNFYNTNEIHGYSVRFVRDASTASTKGYSDAITIYPNPTTSIVTLQGGKQYDIEVYDMAGNKVMALTGNTIDMSHLSSATYIVKALDKVENEEVSYKVVKN
jgi:uncharacterized protein (TIGR02145 family)